MSLVLAALRRAARCHRLLMLMVASMLLLLVVSAAGLALDGRMPLGTPVWLKLLKLAVSLAVYGTTLAWMLSLPTGSGGGPPGRPPSPPSPGPPTPPSSRPASRPVTGHRPAPAGVRAGGAAAGRSRGCRRRRAFSSKCSSHRRDRYFDHPQREL
ncbi:hypothetical protein AB0L44_14475 [Nonomuraea wenchangensis]|uniref:hypothetical protein n=1 Tax=Nonomuraea wenchangensis TaxID=568860 RepID=UPI0034431D31